MISKRQPLQVSSRDGYLAVVLDRLDSPLLVIDQDRNVVFQNAAARSITKKGMGICIRSERLVLSTQEGNEWLQRSVCGDTSISTPTPLHGCRGHRVPRHAATRDWLVLLTPLRPTEERRYFIVHLVCRLRSRALPESVLEDLFKLTRREIEIVARLSRSEQLRLIAVNMKISHETVRTYLKRVLRKCGVKSQAELLCLTQQLSLFHHVGVSGG
jgi:DNA-binding CsgD family transcriptional regulator